MKSAQINATRQAKPAVTKPSVLGNSNAAGPSEPDRMIRSLDRALRFARASLSPDITAQRLLILLNVYMNEGLSQRELSGVLDSTSATALSRNLADLSNLTTRKQPGPGLLELRADPMNLRVKRVHLTPEGRKFVTQWVKAIQFE